MKHSAIQLLPIDWIWQLIVRTALTIAISCGSICSIADNRKFALLVACTKYDHMPESCYLSGPSNDVMLLKQLLEDENFGFREKDVTILAESDELNSEVVSSRTIATSRPTRANIESEFRRLAATARDGDQVVILLSGHGSQQPQQKESPDPKPDGLDEVFLPADVGSCENGSDQIPGGIPDFELNRWLAAIRRSGAFVWIIIDSCNSGTMIRGAEEVRYRSLSPEQFGILLQTLQEAGEKARRGNEENRKQKNVKDIRLSERLDGVVALYACRADEPTIERVMPPGAANGKAFGVLSFTLNQVLRSAKTPLTYRELCQAIRRRYSSMQGEIPTPLIEGGGPNDVDRLVLGTDVLPGRSDTVLSRDSEGKLTLNAGVVNGLNEGAILAVFPPAGQKRADRILGHVRVETADICSSSVTPVEFDNMPQPDAEHLPDGARGEVVFATFKDFRLAMAVDTAAQGDVQSLEGRDRLKTCLANLAKSENSFVQIVTPSRASWLLQIKSGDVYLTPANSAGSARVPSNQPLTKSYYGPVPLNEGFSNWLEERTRRIARSQNLIALADTAGATSTASLGELELLHLKSGQGIPSDDDADWAAIHDDGDVHLHAGETVGIRINNKGDGAVDIDATLLLVDSDCGIEALFPDLSGAGRNRIPAGKAPIVFRARATLSHGREHLVMISVASNREPLDFSSLAQPSLLSTRGRENESGSQSSFQQLLDSALYRQSTIRGLSSVDAKRSEMRMISWRVVE